MSRVFFRHIEVVGLENIPADGAVVLAGLGAVPVSRRSDHGGGKVAGLAGDPTVEAALRAANEAAFTAMFDVLGKGGAIGIFPEGLSHDESSLAKLKTGAA